MFNARRLHLAAHENHIAAGLSHKSSSRVAQLLLPRLTGLRSRNGVADFMRLRQPHAKDSNGPKASAYASR
jgi:hypothetical protein